MNQEKRRIVNNLTDQQIEMLWSIIGWDNDFIPTSEELQKGLVILLTQLRPDLTEQQFQADYERK